MSGFQYETLFTIPVVSIWFATSVPSPAGASVWIRNEYRETGAAAVPSFVSARVSLVCTARSVPSESGSGLR